MSNLGRSDTHDNRNQLRWQLWTEKTQIQQCWFQCHEGTVGSPLKPKDISRRGADKEAGRQKSILTHRLHCNIRNGYRWTHATYLTHNSHKISCTVATRCHCRSWHDGRRGRGRRSRNLTWCTGRLLSWCPGRRIRWCLRRSPCGRRRWCTGRESCW